MCEVSIISTPFKSEELKSVSLIVEGWAAVLYVDIGGGYINHSSFHR